MVDDRPEDTGSPAESARPKRAGPTIDLEATEVSGDVRTPPPAPRPNPHPGGRRHRRLFPVIIAAFAGAGTAAAVLAVAWYLGWNAASPLPAPPADTAAIDGLAARIASVESKANAPSPRQPAVPDAAAAARIESLEKSSASLRDELAAARAQSEKLAALVDEMKSAPREPPPPAPDLSAINERLAQLEHTSARAGLRDRTGQAGEGECQAGRMTCRFAASSRLPCSIFRFGRAIPMSQHWRRRKLSAPDADALKPLDGFAASGVPSPAIALPRVADAGSKTVAAGAGKSDRRCRRHRRSPAGGRVAAGPHRADRRRGQ